MSGTTRTLLRRTCPLGMAVLLGGCSQSAGTVPVRPTITPGPATDLAALLRGRGYTPDYRIRVTVAPGQTIVVVHSVCTGSADGHCQALDAFDRDGHDLWRRQYTDVLRLSPATRGFMVQSARYRAGDPLCCPTGGVRTERFVWNGSTFTGLGSSRGAAR